MKRMLFTVAALAAIAFPCFPVPIYQGGNGSISMGVAPYGGPPNNGGPTYILNNFTGRVDVLSSPGGGYLTADPSAVFNIHQTGAAGLPMALAAVGGANGVGAFGFGASGILGPLVGYRLFDINADGVGAATYSISSWISTWNNVGAYNGPVGAWLTTGGRFGTPVSAGAVSLIVNASSVTAGSPFNVPGGLDFGQLVLAPRANGACFGINGAVQCTGSTFRGIARTSQNLNIPNNDVITVTATLTAIIDPDFLMGMLAADQDLLDLLGPGTTLPDFNFAGMDPDQAVPEPGTFVLAGFGIVALLLRYRKL